MVVVLRPDVTNDPWLNRMIGKLGGLVSDMEALRLGSSPEELADRAPFLENWRCRFGNNLFLDGLSSGHPKLVGINRPISTSEVFLLTHDKRFVRTLSRWYQLGEPRDTRPQHD
jgi:hypothetical protein